jgi:PKD repeat protein
LCQPILGHDNTYVPGNYTVTLVATSQSGCVDSLKKNNYISVRQLIPDFTVSDTILCSLPDTISAEGKDASVRYYWLIDNMTVRAKTGRTPEFEIRKIDEGIHTLKLTIEDIRSAGNCMADTTITLHFYNKATPKITATDTNECAPTHVISFTNTTQYPSWADDFGMAQTYWNFRDGTNGTGDTAIHVYGTSAVPEGASPDGGYGDYRVMMSGTTPYGCPLDTVYQNIHILRMYAAAGVIDPAPPDLPHGCAPHTVELVNIEDSLVTSSPIVSYVWKWNFTGDNADPNDTTVGDISGNAQHTYTDTGKYNVYLTLTNEQGCVHDIFVKHIMIGYPPLTNFTFLSDTNCKSLLNIMVMAYDSVDNNGNLVANARANSWAWLDDNDNPIGGPIDTTTISPNETGDAVVNLVSSHNGCNTEYRIRKDSLLGYVCPPVAIIREPKDDDNGYPFFYCQFEEIPFINESKGAIYLKWYAGDYFPNYDTAKHSKSPLMKYDTILKDYIQYNENGDSVGIGGDWTFTYSDTSASNYLMNRNGLVTLWLWAMNDNSVTNDPTHELFNPCGRCEHVATQDVIISVARMNFTVSQNAICQGDSVRFYDSTQSSVGLLGWGFKFDSAWNNSPDYLETTLGEYVEIKNYTPDPKYGNGQWLTFTKPNRYRLVLQDTCVYGCVKTDTLILDVLPKSIPRITTSIDGITYNYGKTDTICINSGGQYYMRDSSWFPHPYENTKITGWEWQVGAVKDTGQNASLTLSSSGYYHLSLTLENEFGCDTTAIFKNQLLVNSILPHFSTPEKSVCNKAKISFTDETTVLPVANNKNTLLKLHYDWGDGDTSVIYSKSGEQPVTTHLYDLPNLKNTVYIKLTATIIDPITYLPTGYVAEYIDSIIVSRPIAAFTDDGHEFPCPDHTNGTKGRTIQFTSQAQGELGNNALLRWNFGDTASGLRNEILVTDSNVITPTHRYDRAGVYDVLFIVQDENTCTDSILKKNHVVILGPRGTVSNVEDSSNCKPLQVTFYPLVEQDQEFQPDSIAIHVGTGETLVNKGDYFGLTRSRRHIYQNAGAYLPVYFLYKTVNFSGSIETCIVQINAEDSIYVVDITPNFETETLFSTQAPVTFKNTSSWVPSYLENTSVTMTWDMGNGDLSHNYNGETQYNTAGIYPVKLSVQVLRCMREKTINIEIIHVDVFSNNSVMGIVTGSGNYPKNAIITLTAMPNTGYQFVRWHDGNTQNPRTVTVTQNTSFTAIFDTAKHNVTVTANNSAMGTVTGLGVYTVNTVALIEATPNVNYRFIQWNDGDVSNPRTITVTQDTTFTAIFGAQGLLNVYVSLNNTIMGTVTGSGDYVNNTSVTISATPNVNYRFIQWNDGNTTNPRTITLTQDTIFTAIFDIIRYELSLSINDTSRGIVSGNGTYAINSIATITAVPKAGYRFVGWSDNNKDSVRTITVTHDTVFVALFGKDNMYYVYAAPNNPIMGNVIGSNDYQKSNGQKSPVFKREYAAKSLASIEALPNPNHRFVQWNDGNTDNPREFTVTRDSIFMAIFESTTSIIDLETSNISVYPNPTRDYIHIVLPDNVYRAVFTLYDMQSKMLLQQEISSQDVVSVSHLAKGIYIYNVITDKQNYTGKLIINVTN